MPTNPKVTRWLSGGDHHTVTTWRNPGETEADWCQRHDDAVAYWQGIFPPD